MEKRELVYYRLDKIDGKILDILQGNARASLKEIAEQVFLSPTAVGDRNTCSAISFKDALAFPCRISKILPSILSSR